MMIGLRFTSVSQFCFKSVLGFVKKEIKHFFLRKQLLFGFIHDCDVYC